MADHHERFEADAPYYPTGDPTLLDRLQMAWRTSG